MKHGLKYREVAATDRLRRDALASMFFDGACRFPEHEPKVHAAGVLGRLGFLHSCVLFHEEKDSRNYLVVKSLYVETISLSTGVPRAGLAQAPDWCNLPLRSLQLIIN